MTGGKEKDFNASIVHLDVWSGVGSKGRTT